MIIFGFLIVFIYRYFESNIYSSLRSLYRKTGFDFFDWLSMQMISNETLAIFIIMLPLLVFFGFSATARKLV